LDYVTNGQDEPSTKESIRRLNVLVILIEKKRREEERKLKRFFSLCVLL
jgi:hypothetical protein